MAASAPTTLIRLRRLLAVLLLGIAVVVTVVYLRQHRSDARAQKARAPVLPVKMNLIQTEDHFQLTASSRTGVTLFRVTTDRAEQLKVGSQWVLHHVHIIVYAADGVQVADDIRGEQFAYDQGAESAVAQGEVQIDLNSRPAVQDIAAGTLPAAAGAQLTPPSPVHMVARDLAFNTRTGEADVTQGINFSYESARGSAQRAHLLGHEATLAGALRLDWNQPGRPPVTVTADSADLDRDSGEVQLHGGVRVSQPDARLAADAINVTLTPDYSLRHARARGSVTASAAQPGRKMNASAAIADADFAPPAPGERSEITSLHLGGGVRMQQDQSGSAREKTPGKATNTALSADAVNMVFASGNNLRNATATGNALVRMSTEPNLVRTVAAPRIDFAWNPAQSGAQPTLATVDARGTTHIDLSGASTVAVAAAGAAKPAAAGAMQVDAQPPSAASDAAPALHLDLDDAQQLTHATAGGGGIVVHQAQAFGTRIVNARMLELWFTTANTQPSKAVMTGNVDVVDPQPDGFRRLRADEVVSTTADGRSLLIATPGSAWTGGRVSGSDAQDRFSSASAVLIQPPGSSTSRLEADGSVQLAMSGSSQFRPAGLLASANSDKQQPVAALADGATFETDGDAGAKSTGGNAVLTGHVRLWQGGNMLFADRVALDRERASLAADGHVIAFYAASQGLASVALPGPPAPKSRPSAAPVAKKPPAPTPTSISIAAAHLDYDNLTRQAKWTGAVEVHTGRERLNADEVQVWLSQPDPTKPTPAKTKPDATDPPASGLERAIASGHVLVNRAGQTVTAAQASYQGSTQMAVFSGGDPRICDAEQACFTGEPLTYSRRDGEMTISSKNGSPATGRVQIH